MAVEVDQSPVEKDSNYINYFLLELSAPLEIDATVKYHTRDGTARAGEDYMATSGVATILAGETSTTIPVEIIGDNVPETNETFSLVITNPTGGNFPDSNGEIIATHNILDDDIMVSGVSGSMNEIFLAA